MSDRWTLGDIFDYEFFLAKELDRSSKAEDSRAWFQEYAGKTLPGCLLKSWLTYKRNVTHCILPGKTVTRIYYIVAVLLVVFGFIAGIGLGGGILVYDAGSHPVNLFLALSVLVLIPFLFTVLSLIFAILPSGSARYRKLFDRRTECFQKITKFFRYTGLVDRDHADAVTNGISRFKGRSDLYRKLLRRSFSVIIQLRALSFHLGILVIVFWKGTIQDMAFGWQTTLNVKTSTIYKMLCALSRPWHALSPSPSLSEVEGSRIILKNGIDGLNNTDLTVWWLYLCFAILFYGVLPRILLLAGNYTRQRILLGSLPFTDGKSRHLLLTITSSRVETTGKEPDREQVLKSAGNRSTMLKSSMVFNLLIPSMREDLVVKEQWRKILFDQWGTVPEEILTVTLDDEKDAEMIDKMLRRKNNINGIILVLEGWRPYTVEAGLYVDFLLSQKSVLLVLVALSGRPGEGFRMEERDKETWKQWKWMLPAAVTSGSCEIVDIKGWE